MMFLYVVEIFVLIPLVLPFPMLVQSCDAFLFVGSVIKML